MSASPVWKLFLALSLLLLELGGEGRLYAQNGHTDTVYITRMVRVPDYSDRQMLFALRTNFLAIPLANLGIEVPLDRRWSIGADIYYPWIRRPGHAEGVDRNGVCNELLAADVELRYWFPRKGMQGGQRLLGHSIGFYGATGMYDFERNWSGIQGEFLVGNPG